MRRFADGLERDMEAAQGVQYRYRGGHGNRLKMIKRHMYEMASLALLWIRVVHGSKNVRHLKSERASIIIALAIL